MRRRDFLIDFALSAGAGSLAGITGCEPAARPSAAADSGDHMAAFAPDSSSRALLERPRTIAMLAYPGMFPLDLVGPHAVLSGLMQVTVHIVGATRDPIAANGITIVPDTTFSDCPGTVDVLFVPGGGEGTLAAMRDPTLLGFLRDRAPRAGWVGSVCTGSLVLGAAGLLRGYRATTHWVAHEVLSTFGATPVQARVVEDRNRITAAGVSAGLDFALQLAARLAGVPYAQGLQLNIEYDPAPPFDAGSPAKAPPAMTATLREMYGPLVEAMRKVAAA